jgi:hypothetical protein
MRALSTLVAVCVCAAAACTTAPSGSGGGADLRTNNATGTVTTTLASSLEASHAAAVQAMQDLKYSVTEKPLDANKGVVKATTADGSKVEATVEREGDKMSKLSVNAGITKSDVARTVARKIQEKTH